MLLDALNRGQCFSLPGVFDPFSARIAAHYVNGPLYMTGYGVAATLLGKPDAGLVSYSQMVERLAQITAVIDVPVVADGDTGAAAIQLEDQEFPKRCGHTPDRRVIDLIDMQKKIKVAVATRNQQDFMIIARTDARTALGLDEALRRAEAYLAAGADALFVESPETETELRQIAEAFQGVPLVANMVAGGRTPMLPDQTLFELGFQLVIHPTYLLGALTSGLEQGLAHLVATGTENEQVAQFDRLNHWVDFESIWALDEED